MVSFPLDMYAEMGLLGHVLVLFLDYYRRHSCDVHANKSLIMCREPAVTAVVSLELMSPVLTLPAGVCIIHLSYIISFTLQDNSMNWTLINPSLQIQRLIFRQ